MNEMTVRQAKYRIAWLPGDGIGVDVLDATKIVLDKLKLDAEYIHGDIGWEFWCQEGDALPQRTVDLLNRVDAAMFGAITSKPVKAAELELAPELQGQGFVYRSPIVRLRQLFDLYICLRPCKAYPGNPLNYREDIDLVIFRENTEDLYSGVEFNPVPAELAEVLGRLSKQFGPFKDVPLDEMAISNKIVTCKGSERIIRAAFEFARKHGRKKVTVIHKANVVRATEGLFLEIGKEVHKDFPEIEMDDANVDAMSMWLIKNPKNYDVMVATNMFGDIISDLSAQIGGRAGLRLLGQHRRQAGGLRAQSRLGTQVRRAVQGEPDRHDPLRQDDARLAGRDGEGRGAREGDRRSDPRRPGPHVRYGRLEQHARDRRSDRSKTVAAL